MRSRCWSWIKHAELRLIPSSDATQHPANRTRTKIQNPDPSHSTVSNWLLVVLELMVTFDSVDLAVVLWILWSGLQTVPASLSGVPQGSSLALLVFSLLPLGFIANHQNFKLTCYADDVIFIHQAELSVPGSRTTSKQNGSHMETKLLLLAWVISPQVKNPKSHLTKQLD